MERADGLDYVLECERYPRRIPCVEDDRDILRVNQLSLERICDIRAHVCHDARLAPIPVVFLSASTAKEDVEGLRELGAAGIFFKPNRACWPGSSRMHGVGQPV